MHVCLEYSEAAMLCFAPGTSAHRKNIPAATAALRVGAMERLEANALRSSVKKSCL